MAAKYRDISQLTKKSSIDGAEKIPVSGTEYITVDQIAGKQVCIHTKKSNALDSQGVKPLYGLHTVIESVSDADLSVMADSNKYRLVLMRWRKHSGEGSRWRIPMLPYEAARRLNGTVASAIAETDTWWPVTGRIVPWFRDGRTLDQALKLSVSQTKKRFCSTRNVKQKIGVALFKKTNTAGEGWSRISTIAYVELLVIARDSILETPLITMTIRS